MSRPVPRHLRLITTNTVLPAARPVLRKVPLKLFKGGRRELSSRTDPIEEFAVVDHYGGKAGFRHASGAAELRRIAEKLFLQGHCTLELITMTEYAGCIPQSSRGFFPHAKPLKMRDNTRMDNDSLIDRIDRRLHIIGLSREKASKAAGHGRDYIRNIADGSSKNPGGPRMVALAKVLDCHYHWLMTGEGPETVDPEGDDRESRLLSIFWLMTPEQQNAFLQMGEVIGKPPAPLQPSGSDK